MLKNEIIAENEGFWNSLSDHKIAPRKIFCSESSFSVAITPREQINVYQQF